MRSGGARRGKVGVVIGGGSGHYPAFAGLVGEGMADAAVVGDVFTSPSGEQAYRVGGAVDGGAGVLFSFGNYAGDVLNFGAAEQRLRASGTDCRTVLVTDDVASAGPDDIGRRRGIAGGLVVFKAAGAASARGDGIDEVERIARKANAATRTLGVAFGACTLPGQSEPLFTIAPGRYEIGMGIHGEPGVRTVDAVPVEELAAHLLEPLLAERPDDASGRVAAALNGLGSVKYEELFILWRHIAKRLDRAGLELVCPEVGEFVTSLDMAGCSLTVSWLDSELEELWVAPANTPAFRRGNAEGLREFELIAPAANLDAADSPGPSTGVSARAERAAALSRDVLDAMLRVVSAHADELGRVDAVAGDGDHGFGMTRGLGAATEAAAVPGSVGTTIRAAGRAFADRAGGTSGVIWGAMLESFADSLGADEVPSAQAVAQAVTAANRTAQAVGGAAVGDKTLVDALDPFARALEEQIGEGKSLAAGWATAAQVAGEAAQATAALVPRIGRARPLAERSLGTVDAGALSFALCVNAAALVLDRECNG
jgi:dihydroxyacetone kinase